MQTLTVREVLPLEKPEVAGPRAWVPLGVAILVFAGLSLAGAITSDAFLEADACTHYLFARFAFEEPHYFVNVWGRPICTGLYSVPALLGGRLGVRITSMLLAIGCALIAWRVARGQGYRWPALAAIFTLGQPLLFLHSFSELTELPFAFLLILAFWAYQRRMWWAVALVAGLLPLSRPEGFGFIGLAALALVAHRRWWWAPLVVLPLGLWSYAGWVMWGRPVYEGLPLPGWLHWVMWLRHEWPYAGESLYDPGTLVHFVALLPAIVSPLVLPFVWIGVWRSWRDRDATDRHQRWIQRLIAALPLMILIGHSVLYFLGKMASNGEVRYLLVVAPFWALLGARGWEWVWARLEWRRPFAWAGAAVLAPLTLNLAYPIVPLQYTEDWRTAERVANWYRESGIAVDYPYVSASHPGVYFFLDISPSGRHSKDWGKATVRETPPGTMLVWDPVYALYNADGERSVPGPEVIDAGWLWRHEPPRYAQWRMRGMGSQNHKMPLWDFWQVFLSPTTVEGEATAVMPLPKNRFAEDLRFEGSVEWTVPATTGPVDPR